MKQRKCTSSGQALITVLFIAVIGLLITTGAITGLMSAYGSMSQGEMGLLAYGAAESGIENSILRIMRDPTYTGETLTTGTGQTAVITVSTASGVTITSVGAVSTVSRKIVVRGHITNLVFVLDSWNEVP